MKGIYVDPTAIGAEEMREKMMEALKGGDYVDPYGYGTDAFPWKIVISIVANVAVTVIAELF